MEAKEIFRSVEQFGEACGNCVFWNPRPSPDPIFTLRECYKYYEGDAFLDNAKSFNPLPQDSVLIPLAQTPAHFKCAKYKQAKENQNGTYESEFKIPQANVKAAEKHKAIFAKTYGQEAEGKSEADRIAGGKDEGNSLQGQADSKEKSNQAYDEGIISTDFPPS